MSLFDETFDDLTEILVEQSQAGQPLTVDQRLKVVEIRALLSISQELSKIHHEGINPEYDSGM